MSSSKKNDVISVASPHTIKKFELISEYVKAWSEILLVAKDSNGKPICNGIVYIDCMSNSGVYRKEKADAEIIEGTPLRVANILAETMKKYPTQQAYLYFNDYDSNKIDELNTRLPKQTDNFHIQTYAMDASELLNKISSQFKNVFQGMHFLLIYDPYDANIDWDALMPFMKNWGEVIINHMVSDTVRAAKTAKKQEVIDKYEKTYRTNIEELVSFGSNRAAFEEKIQTIIKELSGREERYYVASYPFFNKMNSVVYNLIHCTGHAKGFDLYKATAWKTFHDKSSGKHVIDDSDYGQLCINPATGEIEYENNTDDSCYIVRDIAEYLQEHFKGRADVEKNEVFEYLFDHPVFPVRSYKQKICNDLKTYYAAVIHRSTITFSDRSC